MIIRPKQFSRMSKFCLEESTSDVLLEAKCEEKRLGMAEISRKSDLHRKRGGHNMMNDSVIQGILNKLSGQKKVQRCSQQNPEKKDWKTANEEFERRRDNVLVQN